MPELPEVETIRLGMDRALTGLEVAKVTLNRADLRVPFPADMHRKLKGQRIKSIDRRAKYILMTMENGLVIVIHLGMSGRILLSSGKNSQTRKHDHMVFDFKGGDRFTLNDPRRFGIVLMMPGNEIKQHKSFADMGPEPLESGFDAKILLAALEGKKANIKVALLDQSVVAGLGNIYVCEALYEAGINPNRLAATIKKDEATALVKTIRAVLQRALKAGGSTLKDYRHADGEMGYFQHSFRVYDREGEACPRCARKVKTGSSVIKRIVQGGRSTFFCPNCQN